MKYETEIKICLEIITISTHVHLYMSSNIQPLYTIIFMYTVYYRLENQQFIYQQLTILLNKVIKKALKYINVFLVGMWCILQGTAMIANPNLITRMNLEHRLLGG